MNGVSYLTMFLEPVKPWLDDPAVSEIMINGPKEIYIEESGRLIKVDSAFPSEPALFAAANNIAKSVGRILNGISAPRRAASGWFPRPCGDSAAFALRNGGGDPEIPNGFASAREPD